MPRQRTIHSTISVDDKVAAATRRNPYSPTLYTWAITHADDWGRMSGNPTEFRLKVCPAMPLTDAEVDEILTILAECGLWTRYEVGGKHYIAFPLQTWWKYQTYIQQIKHQYDGSAYPAPPADPTNPQPPKLTKVERDQLVTDSKEQPRRGPGRPRKYPRPEERSDDKRSNDNGEGDNSGNDNGPTPAPDPMEEGDLMTEEAPPRRLRLTSVPSLEEEEAREQMRMDEPEAREKLKAAGVHPGILEGLVERHASTLGEQLHWWSYNLRVYEQRQISHSPVALLVTAIREEWDAPEEWKAELSQKAICEKRKQERKQSEMEQLEITIADTRRRWQSLPPPIKTQMELQSRDELLKLPTAGEQFKRAPNNPLVQGALWNIRRQLLAAYDAKMTEAIVPCDMDARRSPAALASLVRSSA